MHTPAIKGAIAAIKSRGEDRIKPGDVLAIWAAGAYGMSLSSNYNGRCRAAEVLVEKKKRRLVRRRETNNELLSTDVLA